MTNAEKYLKEEIIVDEFINEYADYYVDETVKKPVVIRENLKKFLQEKTKPTLTEDERVILRNIKNNKAIGRDKDNCLYFGSKGDGRFFINSTFGHLFQFIKGRRRIYDKGVVRK